MARRRWKEQGGGGLEGALQVSLPESLGTPWLLLSYSQGSGVSARLWSAWLRRSSTPSEAEGLNMTHSGELIYQIACKTICTPVIRQLTGINCVS